MFKIRRRRPACAAVQTSALRPDAAPLLALEEATRRSARAALNAATLLVWHQALLVQCRDGGISFEQRAAIDPLIHSQLSVPLVEMIKHAEEHGLITTDEAAQLRIAKTIPH